MATKLINLDIEEVSLCKDGANQGSKVAVFKSVESDMTGEDLQKQLEAVMAERDELKKQVADLTKGEEDVAKKLEKLDPELRGLIEKANADAKAAQEAAKKTADELEKARKESTQKELSTRIAKMKVVAAGDEKQAELLKAVMDAPEATRDTMLKMLEQADAVCAQSEIFKEKGKDQPGDVTSAGAEIEKRAKELMAKNPGMTIHKARTEVRSADTELAKRERAERKESK